MNTATFKQMTIERNAPGLSLLAASLSASRRASFCGDCYQASPIRHCASYQSRNHVHHIRGGNP